jgi:hypothetical protein
VSIYIPLALANDRKLMNFGVVITVDLATILFVEFIRDFRRHKMVRKSQEQVVPEFQMMTKAVW